jgi:hypothetical protein
MTACKALPVTLIEVEAIRLEPLEAFEERVARPTRGQIGLGVLSATPIDKWPGWQVQVPRMATNIAEPTHDA